MLRYYDEIDLFKPVRFDKMTNYRYYSAKQIPLLNYIIKLRDMGFKTDEIKSFFEENETEAQIALLRKKKLELTQKIHDDELKLSQLSTFINNYHEEERVMKFEAVVKEIPATPVLSLRAVIEAYNKEGELWGIFMKHVGKQNLFRYFKRGGMCYAMFFEDEQSENEVYIEIGNEVTEPVVCEELEYKELPVIKEALTVLVAGDYEPNIQVGFNFVGEWLEENGYTFAGPARTVYIKGPEECENPEDYLTEIQVPIQKV
jgi:DNA-binding transcriptional MerR regulator